MSLVSGLYRIIMVQSERKGEGLYMPSIVGRTVSYSEATLLCEEIVNDWVKKYNDARVEKINDHYYKIILSSTIVSVSATWD